MTIGSRIKAARLKKGLSQETLANALGTTKQAIYKYENDIVTNIPTDKVETLSRLLDVTPSYLMGWEIDLQLFAEKEKPSPEGESFEEDVVIVHRDGKAIVRRYTKEQLDAIEAILNQIGDSES
ncbi:MAG: helix-turn-helix transcriptional regulator [Clostridia bacterium]|nr:helix-turn-helix transcriptional regulator [Clostridia bacterium]